MTRTPNNGMHPTPHHAAYHIRCAGTRNAARSMRLNENFVSVTTQPLAKVLVSISSYPGESAFVVSGRGPAFKEKPNAIAVLAQETDLVDLLTSLALGDDDFAVAFPSLSNLNGRRRQQLIATIERHLQVCQRCADKRACDFEFHERLIRSMEANRKANETDSLELAYSELSPSKESSHKLFLSYSSRDKNVARRLAIDLEYLGVRVWFDEWSLEPGDSLHELIGKALEACQFVALILSPNWHYSNWFTKEMYQALSREDQPERKLSFL